MSTIDFSYIRRRPKRSDAQQVISPVKASAARVRTSLSLGASSSPQTLGDDSGTSVNTSYSAPFISERQTQLSSDNPAFRLDKIYSALGSLEVSHVNEFAWEAYNSSGKLLNARDALPVFANRELASFYKENLVVNLRHIKNLRRIIFRCSSNAIISIRDKYVVSFSDEETLPVCSMMNINGHLEFRYETKVSTSLVQEFGIEPTHLISYRSSV